MTELDRERMEQDSLHQSADLELGFYPEGDISVCTNNAAYVEHAIVLNEGEFRTIDQTMNDPEMT
jgi:hypothetical protein